jgi:hypothetical protein
MTKVVHSSEYSTNSIFVGCSVNEDGEPLVEVNGKAIGTVAGLLDFLGRYEGQQKATVNVRWAATGGYLGPTGYKVAAAVDDGRYRSASLLMNVPASTEATPIVLKASDLYAGGAKVKTLDELSKHLANVEIKDAYTGGLSVGSTTTEGADTEAVGRLQRELDDLKASLPKRVEEAIASAQRRNVRPSL